jgi:Rrf2 family transcriptional regulator, iron-sulfur cluster assembly transcription factor
MRGAEAMFSRSSGYAIQALTYLAGQPSGKLVGAREIATTLQIPMPFLWKILRKLSGKKLVRSFKGVRGGYELARPAETIHVSEIMAAGPDDALVRGCVLGLANCDDQQPCALHYRWKSLRTQIEAMLETATLADLVRDAKRARRRRSQRRPATRKSSIS